MSTEKIWNVGSVEKITASKKYDRKWKGLMTIEDVININNKDGKKYSKVVYFKNWKIIGKLN